jgi:hypothetical protein
MTDELETMGPIDYLVVEFPGNRMSGAALPHLIDLVDRGIVRILDLGFILRDADGSVRELMIDELPESVRSDFAVFEGARSGLLDFEDLTDAAGVIDPGSSAGVLVYENAWAAPFATALRRSGARVIADGRIPLALLAADESV